MSKRRVKIPIKSNQEIIQMRLAGQVASQILQELASQVDLGKTTREIDVLAEKLLLAHGVKSAFLGYHGFPGQVCISVNEEVVHGIGGERVIQKGDLVKLDVGIIKNGWTGDNATTIVVGKIPSKIQKFLQASEQSLFEAISWAKEGEKLADLCAAVEGHVKPLGYGVVREFVGHGVGKDLHEEPQVPNYRPSGNNIILKTGMVLAIEPMINIGSPKVQILADAWTVVTQDGLASAHFEHTVLVTAEGPEILTARPREKFV